MVALLEAGVTVPRNATQQQLVNLAREYFSESTPTDRKGRKVAYTSKRSGTKYIENERYSARASTRVSAHLAAVNDEIIENYEEAPVGSFFNTPPSSFSPRIPPPATLGHISNETFRNAQSFYGSFHDLNTSSLLEKAMRDEFIEPNRRKAEEHAKLNHPRTRRGNRYSILSSSTGYLGSTRCNGNLSILNRFGPGIAIYFKWLKFLGYMSFLMTLAVTPQLSTNISAYTGERSTFLAFLESTLFHNVANILLNTTVSSNGTRFTVNCDKACQLKREELGYMYMGTDLLVVLIFLCGIQFQRHYQSLEIINVNKEIISVDDYTVQLVNAPAGCGEESVRRFFHELTGERVHDVYVAENNSELIQLYVKRGNLMDRLWKAASKVYWKRERYLQAQESVKSNIKRASLHRNTSFTDKMKTVYERLETRLNRKERKVHKAIEQYDELYAEYQRLNESRGNFKKSTRAITAFITFKNQVGVLRCLDLFPTSGPSKDPNLIFQGQAIEVRRAPNPSTIVWQTLEYSRWNRVLRKVVTTFAALVVVSLSVSASAVTSWIRDILRSEIKVAECFNQTVLFEESLNFYLNTKKLVDTNLLSCFCGQATWTEAYQAAIDSSSPCNSFWLDKVPVVIYILVITGSVSIVNFLISMTLRRLASFEKHHSLVNMEASIASRLFYVLFINTGLVVLVINADFTWDFIRKIQFMDLATSLVGYKDFSIGWFTDVGMQLLLIMIFNILVPHAEVLLSWLYTMTYSRNLFLRSATSQRELNEWYMGPVFRLHYRIAQNMMTLFVTMMYGPGIPLLYPIMTVSQFTYFWVDKIMLLRYYRNPPSYDAVLASYSAKFSIYAVFPHLVFAIWMYSSPGFFWIPVSESISLTVNETIAGNVVRNVFGEKAAISLIRETVRLSKPWIWPFVAVFTIILLLVILANLFRSFKRLLNKILYCGLVSDTEAIYIHPPLEMAKRKKKLRGLQSYSVLQNPFYQQAFGIDEDFAASHKTLNDILDLPADQLPALPSI